MEARDRFLDKWFTRIQSHQITLPRFQRYTAWTHKEVSALLDSVLRELPVGAALILEVGNEEEFKSRSMTDAPESGEKVTEQLLDGQQRLTALWRSLRDTYPNRTYFVNFEEDPDDPANTLPFADGRHRKVEGDGRRSPLWLDDPKKCWEKSLIPMRLLRPGNEVIGEILTWASSAVDGDSDKKDEIVALILELRAKVIDYNIPFLALDSSTSKEVALDVFIKTNTSSARLSTYDIVVALVEEETSTSLHDYVDKLSATVPRAGAYADIPELVLDVVALRQDRVPSQAGYRGIDFKRMVDEWDTVVKGIEGMTGFLEDEGIFDSRRLPSYTAIPIIAALWEYLPKQPDELGNARTLLRKYLWRSFLTTRYERSSTSYSLQDFRGLRSVLSASGSEESIPVFDEDSYPLPTQEIILEADWPYRKNIIGRGLLALMIKAGADDIADGAKATVASITSKEHPREYHHLFPESTLQDARIEIDAISLVVNCALITWRTNRVISDKDPIVYLKDRAENNALGEEELRRRLQTHLIPYTELAVGYDGMPDDERRARVKNDYEIFLRKRAEILVKAAHVACEGRQFDLHELLKL